MTDTNNTLTPEQKIIILTTRLTFSEENERELAETVRLKIDWYEVLKKASQHGVLSHLWHNLKNRYYEDVMGAGIGAILKFYSLGLRERNSILLQACSNITRELSSNGVDCVPIKGSQLLPVLYKNYNLRRMRDLDFLVRKSDGERIRDVMNSMGYSEGKYDHTTKSVISLDRHAQFLFQMSMHHFIPFIMPIESEFVDCISVEFQFLLDFESDPNLVDLMISRAIRNRDTGYLYLRPADVFLQLCCNLYKDASTATIIYAGDDLRLLGFCDVREYIIQIMSDSQIREALHLSKEMNLEKAVYFVLHALRSIYNDGYEEQLMQALRVKDTKFLDTFGETEYGHPIHWKKSFWQRVFSDNNRDEIMEVPAAAKILGFDQWNP